MVRLELESVYNVLLQVIISSQLRTINDNCPSYVDSQSFQQSLRSFFQSLSPTIYHSFVHVAFNVIDQSDLQNVSWCPYQTPYRSTHSSCQQLLREGGSVCFVDMSLEPFIDIHPTIGVRTLSDERRLTSFVEPHDSLPRHRVADARTQRLVHRHSLFPIHLHSDFYIFKRE